jgi:hypothetical protein
LIATKLNEELKKINVELKNRFTGFLSKTELRQKLADNLGNLKELSNLSAEEIIKWTGGRPVAAVDGSVNSVGSVFPYIIYLLQAQAMISDSKNEVLAEIFSPLVPEHYLQLSNLAEELQALPEQAIMQKKDLALTELELAAAIRAVQTYRPFLILFDGGFARFERYAFAAWQEYQKLALAGGVLTVGVIEEAKSFGLATALGLSVSNPQVYDRELLFGLLQPGEAFLPDFGNVIKKRGYYTAFARFSQSPQAVACDFLDEQQGQAEQIMNYLYAITPSGSRGIPLLLDIVDAEIKISHKEMEMLAEVCLDADIREKYLIANRKRRDF